MPKVISCPKYCAEILIKQNARRREEAYLILRRYKTRGAPVNRMITLFMV